MTSVVAAALLIMDPIGRHDRYFVDPAQAGKLVATVDPSPGQVAAWYVPQVPWPTWIAHAWELPPAALVGARDLATVSDDALVVLRLDRLPVWLDPRVTAEAHAVAGRYAAVRGDHLRLYELGVDR